MEEYFSSLWLSISFVTAWVRSKAVKSLAVLPIASAYFLVAGSSLSIIPNSSSNSGSAFVAPLTSLLKESVTSLPNIAEVSFAALPNLLSWSTLRPEERPIAAACEASLKPICASVAAMISLVRDLIDRKSVV
jgi:hypothetical protein